MAAYTVELFGLTHVFPDLHDIGVELGDEATLGELVAELRRSASALEGKVIKTGEDRLAPLYAFNVNGRFFIDEYDTRVRPADHVLIVTLALGG